MPEVVEHGQGPDELLSAAADADVEPACEDEVAVPERRAEDARPRTAHDRLPRARAREYIQTLRREHERPVRMRRDRRQHRDAPESPPPAPAPLDREEERQVRQRAREQEERVHAPVDAVEEEHPARRDERRRDERGHPSGEPGAERRDRGHARHGEERREQPQRLEAAAEVHDEPGDEEVERRPAPLALHRPEEVEKRLAPDEERERLVLVGRPRGQAREQEARDRQRAAATPRGNQRSARPMRSGSGLVVASVVKPAES